MRHEPSFLDSPPWHDTLKALGNSLGEDSYANCLRANNERMARLSTLLKGCDMIFQNPRADEAESSTLAIFKQFIELQTEINRRLMRDSPRKSSGECQDSSAIMGCKEALTLLVIDISIQKLLGLRVELGVEIINQHKLDEDYEGSTTSWKARLESEIYETFRLLHENLLVARRATPFSTRKMAFMFRVMCAGLNLDVDRHSVWDRLGGAIDEVNGSPFFTNIQFAVQRPIGMTISE
jgi:hypothetical protein